MSRSDRRWPAPSRPATTPLRLRAGRRPRPGRGAGREPRLRTGTTTRLSALTSWRATHLPSGESPYSYFSPGIGGRAGLFDQPRESASVWVDAELGEAAAAGVPVEGDGAVLLPRRPVVDGGDARALLAGHVPQAAAVGVHHVDGVALDPTGVEDEMGEDDPLAVRRPAREHVPVLEIGELDLPGAVRVHDPHMLRILIPGRRLVVDDLLPVRRPARIRLAALSSGQGLEARAVGVHDADVVVVVPRERREGDGPSHGRCRQRGPGLAWRHRGRCRHLAGRSRRRVRRRRAFATAGGEGERRDRDDRCERRSPDGPCQT